MFPFFVDTGEHIPGYDISGKISKWKHFLRVNYNELYAAISNTTVSTKVTCVLDFFCIEKLKPKAS
jgi:hypothetical protein